MKDLSLHSLDIIQNSIRAGASCVEVKMTADENGFIFIGISDDGKGMDAEQISRVKDPFFTTRTTRKVGLGISLLSQKAEQCGGELFVNSDLGMGTEVDVSFRTDHPDCPPLGDIPGCAWMLMASNPDIRIIFSFIGATGNFNWDSRQIVDTLEGMPITDGLIRESILDWFISDFSIFKKSIREL